MGTATELTPDLLVPVGRTLLLGSFAFCLLRSIRGGFDLPLAFERLILGFLALAFFNSGSAVLLTISSELSEAIHRLGDRHELKAMVLEAFRNASKEPPSGGGNTSINLPAVLEQAWRTGVWGIMSTIVDWIFLMVTFLLESAREVFWKLLLFLFPVSCGVYPIFPRMMTNLTFHALELALWFPVLALVEIATGIVARSAMAKTGSWGLYVVAVELLAIILILLIPSVTHKFLSGAFAGDFESQASLIRTAKRAVFVAKSWGTRT